MTSIRSLLAAASTALLGLLLSRLAVWGIDIDQAALEAALVPLSAAVVLYVEQMVNTHVPQLRKLLTVLRLGTSLPVYEHQAAGLEAYVAKHAKS